MIGRPLRIAVIAPLRFPIRRPHAGGLEAAVWSEIEALRRRGHRVTVIAVTGSDHVEPGSVYEMPELGWAAEDARTDKTYPPAYETLSVPLLRRALETIAASPEDVDVVSNHCLHAAPLQIAPRLGVPMVTTLHTPVDETFVRAHHAAAGRGSSFLSVSEHTRREWHRAGVGSDVLANGVDPAVWHLGRGGAGLVWSGRIVPEKAPHLAVAVARALGLPLTIAGRVGDRAYAENVLAPLLDDPATLLGAPAPTTAPRGAGAGRVCYVGELEPAALAQLIGRSALALTTPAWAEPFGLVGPEALMCGTPIVGFAVGGVPEIAAASIGMRLVAPGDVAAMAQAVAELLPHGLDPRFRAAVRERAVSTFSLEARTSVLEQIFSALSDEVSGVAEPTELLA